MESRLSTLTTCVRGSNLTGGLPAKLPSFGGYSLETLPYLRIDNGKTVQSTIYSHWLWHWWALPIPLEAVSPSVLLAA